MADICESCGLTKRTVAQANGLGPCEGTCPTWLRAYVSSRGVKVAGCEIEAYRKLVKALKVIEAAEELALYEHDVTDRVKIAQFDAALAEFRRVHL